VAFGVYGRGIKDFSSEYGYRDYAFALGIDAVGRAAGYIISEEAHPLDVPPLNGLSFSRVVSAPAGFSVFAVTNRFSTLPEVILA